MPQEIERKFLVEDVPDLTSYPPIKILQGYLAIEADGTEVRVRKKGGKYFQTVKRGAGRSRSEFEISLSEERFAALWPATEGRRVEKFRYEIPSGNHMIELDVFKGAHEGLVIAEVEFPSEKESSAFTALDWFGAEVTDDPRYKNQALAVSCHPNRGSSKH